MENVNKNVYICIPELLHCTAGVKHIINQLYCNKIQLESETFSGSAYLSQYRTCLDEQEKDHMDIMGEKKSFFFVCLFVFNVENT